MKWLIVEMLLLALLGTPTRASADPIPARQITAGQLVGRPGQFEVFGPGFALRGVEGINQFGCDPCVAGFNSLTYAGEIGVLSGTVDGVTYPRIFIDGNNPGSISAQGSFFIPPGAQTGTVLTFPFSTLEFDHVVGFNNRDDPALFNPPAFAFPITGSGTASLALFRLDNGGQTEFFANSILWTFGSGPSPTPEPASVLLVATGVGAILARRMRPSHARRHRAH